eukprot:g2854.t1
MSRMPADMLVVNKKEPNGKFWISVTLDGITLVSTEPDSNFTRKFSYAEDSQERLLRWGAKGNLLQLVVQAFGSKREHKHKGRLPLTIVLYCPAAIDVAYLIHRISADCFLGQAEEQRQKEAAEKEQKAKEARQFLQDAQAASKDVSSTMRREKKEKKEKKDKKLKKEDGGGEKKKKKEKKEKKEAEHRGEGGGKPSPGKQSAIEQSTDLLGA